MKVINYLIVKWNKKKETTADFLELLWTLTEKHKILVINVYRYNRK